MTNPTFQMSADARLLMQHMQTATVGQTVTYAELTAVISSKVTGATGALQTALRRLSKDKDMVFGSIRGVGFKRLSSAEIVDAGAQAIDSVRRKSRRAVEKQMKADFSKLDRDHQGRFSAQVSVLGAVAMKTRTTEISRIAKAITPDQKELSIAATLKMFSGGAA